MSCLKTLLKQSNEVTKVFEISDTMRKWEENLLPTFIRTPYISTFLKLCLNTYLHREFFKKAWSQELPTQPHSKILFVHSRPFSPPLSSPLCAFRKNMYVIFSIKFSLFHFLSTFHLFGFCCNLLTPTSCPLLLSIFALLFCLPSLFFLPSQGHR